ncbi:PKD domain-containing protein, partial [Candidatus Dojkabacteria bacterium]|nr:PKD domain-containing protein [Candidatus Dojkabacteria bacterium]
MKSTYNKIKKYFISIICVIAFFSLLSSLTPVCMLVNAAVTEPVYSTISDYYDNRKAVVTVTADDWGSSTDSEFEDFNNMLVSKHLYYTAGLMTSYVDNDYWSIIQDYLNQGYLEVASHSRTHSYLSSYDLAKYDSEIGGSKQDIIGNLTMPPMFSFDGKEYVYTWIEPYGESDSIERLKLGEYEYLVDRSVESDFDEWASWDGGNDLFRRIGFSIDMEDPESWTTVDDIDELNEKFDSVYSAGGIYQFTTHPENLNMEPGEYADLHTTYISNRKDVWYVYLGPLYLYHWVDTRNVVQVTSTGALQNKVFKITIPQADHQKFGVKYPVTYVFDIPSGWGNPYVNYRFRTGDSWTALPTKTSSDFFNGINAVRFDLANDKAYVSIGFGDISHDIYLQILEDTQPIANFGASPRTGEEPLTVSFSDLSTSDNGIVSWLWNFGDGATSNQQNPTHSYNEGVFTVSLRVTDSDGDFDTETKTGYITVTAVNLPPVADFSASPASGFEPLTVSFSDASTSGDGIVSWSWSFGDGGTSSAQNPTHVYDAGTYTVSLTVTESDSDLDTETKAAYITVKTVGLSSIVEGLQSWYWSEDTVINSVAEADVDDDGSVEIVTGGYYNDGERDVAQLVVWDGSALSVDRLTTWYWTGDTRINSVDVGNLDADGSVEVVSGGFFNDGVRDVAQLVVWSGDLQSVENLASWYWTGDTRVESVCVGDVDVAGGDVEIVTGGYYTDGQRIAQLVVWDGELLAVESVQVWYWTGDTQVNSVSVGNVDADAYKEIVTGGYYDNGVNLNAQLVVWAIQPELPEYTLTVNVDGNGDVALNGTSPFVAGTVVQLTASADAGWEFGG